MTATASKSRPRQHLRWIVLGWSMVALASAPAIALSSDLPLKGIANQGVLALVLAACAYLPWALATPALLRLNRALPITGPTVARHAAALAVVGATGTVAITGAGAVLGRAALALLTSASEMPLFADLDRQIAVTSLFALPTYIAVTAVGQTLAWAGRDRRRERQLIDAREEALRSQLRPHFLFNALGAIAEIGHANADRADRALTGLSRLLRATLDAPDTQSLAKEIAAADNLVALHQLLLGGRLHWMARVSGPAADCAVPALILQPLIENAVKFASDGTVQGDVVLKAEVEDNRLVVSITNSITPGPRIGTGRGLTLVRDRLAALYGEAAELWTAGDNRHFQIRLSLPAVPVVAR